MAVENKNVGVLPTDVQTFQLTRNLYAAGAGQGVIYNTFEVAAADDDLSVYRVFPGLGFNVIPLGILVANDALTSSTDWDVGLYDANLGAVINRECFGAALNLSSAHAALIAGTALNGFAVVAIENYGKRLYEHAGHTAFNKRDYYDIALTAVTVGSGAGTVSTLLNFALG